MQWRLAFTARRAAPLPRGSLIHSAEYLRDPNEEGAGSLRFAVDPSIWTLNCPNGLIDLKSLEQIAEDERADNPL